MTEALPTIGCGNVRSKRIRKFFYYFISFCFGCILVNLLHYFEHPADVSGKVGAWRRRQNLGIQNRSEVAQLNPIGVSSSPPSPSSFERNVSSELTINASSDAVNREQQRLRRQHLFDVCNKLNYSTIGQTVAQNRSVKLDIRHNRRILVDNERRFLYCPIPKVACSNWKKVLLFLTGKMNVTSVDDLANVFPHTRLQATYFKKMSDYTMDEIQYRVDTYFKFIFVRHPFERILSAYFNKFVQNNIPFRRKYGRHIIENFRENPTNESLQYGHDVTFKEFVAYLLDHDVTETYLYDPHWRPFHLLCEPCLIKYDLIGKYETFDEDADWTLSLLGARGIVRFPKSKSVRAKTSELLVEQFRNISDQDIYRLWERYYEDFAMFGYPYPSFLMK